MRFRRGISDRMKQMLARIKREQLESWACGLLELTQKRMETNAACNILQNSCK